MNQNKKNTHEFNTNNNNVEVKGSVWRGLENTMEKICDSNWTACWTDKEGITQTAVAPKGSLRFNDTAKQFEQWIGGQWVMWDTSFMVEGVISCPKRWEYMLRDGKWDSVSWKDRFNRQSPLWNHIQKSFAQTPNQHKPAQRTSGQGWCSGMGGSRNAS